jgi:hypothetical protein
VGVDRHTGWDDWSKEVAESGSVVAGVGSFVELLLVLHDGNTAAFCLLFSGVHQ